MKFTKRFLSVVVFTMLSLLVAGVPLTLAQNPPSLPPQLIEVVGKWGLKPEDLGTLVQNLGAAQGDSEKIVEALTAANLDPKLLRRFISETDPALVSPLLQAVGIDPASVPGILEQFDQAALQKEMDEDSLAPEDLDTLFGESSEDDFNQLVTDHDLTAEDVAQLGWFFTDTTIEDPYGLTDKDLNEFIAGSFESPEQVLQFWGMTEDGLKQFLGQVAQGADVFALAGQFGFSPENVMDIVYSLGNTDYANNLLTEAGLDPETFYSDLDAAYEQVAFDGSVEQQALTEEEASGEEGSGEEDTGEEASGDEDNGEEASGDEDSSDDDNGEDASGDEDNSSDDNTEGDSSGG